MEVKIIALKQKSSYCKTVCSLSKNTTNKVTTERLFPFFELMLKALNKEQMINEQRSI